MTNHDRLFKELLTTFFMEFLELFFPKVAAYVDPGSLEFPDKQVFTDVKSCPSDRSLAGALFFYPGSQICGQDFVEPREVLSLPLDCIGEL